MAVTNRPSNMRTGKCTNWPWHTTQPGQQVVLVRRN